jgi:RNA-directed DNA polymerase
MNRKNLLRPLAASLADQEWTASALKHHLQGRLPPPLQKWAASLAGHLIEAFPKPSAPDISPILDLVAASTAGQSIARWCERNGVYIPLLLTPAIFRPVPALAEAKVPPFTTPTELADFLSISEGDLVRFADPHLLAARTANAFAPHYRHHLIAKRDGTLRLIEEPKPFLKRLQRRLLNGLLDHIPQHDASFAFRPGRNVLMNASRHAGEQVVIGFDLADFFPRVDFARIYGIFRALGYPPGVGRLLAGLTTTAAYHLPDGPIAARNFLSHRHLPQGAPTSPALANLVAFRLDQRLAGLARSLEANYSRYADDLTFSGDRVIVKTLLAAVPEITRDEGFVLRQTKTRVQPAYQRQVVTGLVVNEQVHVARATRDKLKATLHCLSKGDARRSDPSFMAELSGKISWVEQIAPHHGHGFRAVFDAL